MTMGFLKRVFALAISLTLIAMLLPTAALAATREIVLTEDNGLSVEGNVSSSHSLLKKGSNYQMVVRATSTGGAFKLVLINPDGDETDIIGSLPTNRSHTVWNNINISCTTTMGTWKVGDYCRFAVVDDDSDTTVSNSNIKLVNFKKEKVRENQTIDPVFEITDYNVDAENVASNPYLSGYTSNGSFVLNGSSNVEVTRLPDKEIETGHLVFQVKMHLKYTGKGNTVSFTMAYRTKNDVTRTIDVTTTIPYTEEADSDDDDDDDDDDYEDTPIPYIIVDSYTINGGAGNVTAGEEFTLTMKLRNTSSTHSVENVVMSVSPKGVFSMTSSSNTFFLNRLQAGSIMERTITLKAGLTKVTDDEDANSIDIKFTYQYGIIKDSKTTLQSGDSSESITMPVNFPDRFELGIATLESDMAYTGENCYVSVPMVNKGRSGVYNLTAMVRGEGMANPGQSQYIGNLEAGSENTAEFSVIYNEPGIYTGEIVVTYEDTNMNPKEVISIFSITVEEMSFDDPGVFPDDFPDEPAEPVNVEPKNDPTRPARIILALLIGSMSCYVTVQKAKAKRSIFLDEDL